MTLYQLKEFSKLAENGLSEKQPFWATHKRPSPTVFKTDYSEYFPKYPKEVAVVDSFN